jgi:hypothetical protein
VHFLNSLATNVKSEMPVLELGLTGDSLATDVTVSHVVVVLSRPYSVGVDDKDISRTGAAVGCCGRQSVEQVAGAVVMKPVRAD